MTLHGDGLRSVAEFDVSAGERVPFVLSWFPSNEEPPAPVVSEETLAATERFWRAWCAKGSDEGPYRDHIVRSLITLKALVYAPTGGLVAAVTTSLPEVLGGKRNWDYRYCWLRDSTFTLYALLHGGYLEEARAFRDWLLRAVAGDPGKLQICYGLAGERRLPETELGWLSGYEGSKPVHIGNAASGQLQLDVYGEVSDTLHQARRHGKLPAILFARCAHQQGAQPERAAKACGAPQRLVASSAQTNGVLPPSSTDSAKQALSESAAEWRHGAGAAHVRVTATLQR